jgi:hypothetical protein
VGVGGVAPFKPLEEAWEMIGGLFAGLESREVQKEDYARD